MEKIFLGNSLKLLSLSLPSFFFLFYILLMALPCFAHFNLMENGVRNTYFLAIQSVLITFPLGVCLANLSVKKPIITIKNFLETKLKKTAIDQKFIPILIILFLSTIPIVVLYYLSVDYVQLFEVFKKSPVEISASDLRFAQKTAPDIVNGLFELLRRLFLPLCVLYFFFVSHLYKNKRWKKITWLLFAITLIISALTLDRAEPFSLFIMIILAYLLVKNLAISKILKPKLLIVFFIAISLGAIISIFQYQSSFTISRLVNNVKYVFLTRIVLDPTFMASWAFREFTAPPFLNGGSIKIISLLTGTNYKAAYPASFVGDLWRNFGWLGVIIGSIIFGFILQLIQLKLFKKKNAFTLSIYVILMINTVWLIFGNALGTISVSVFILSLLLLFWANKINGKSPPSIPTN